MVPTFSNSTKIVTVTATLPAQTDGGLNIRDTDIRVAFDEFVRSAQRDYGVAVSNVDVTVADGPRTVTLTEDEYNALRQGGNAGA